MRRVAWVVASLALGGACGQGCGRSAPGVDLLSPAVRITGTVAGHDAAWISERAGQGVRINDVVQRTLPASPPSRLEVALTVPKGGHLRVSCGIPPSRQDRPGVEFVIKVKEPGGEKILASQLVDPMNHPTHRQWVPLDVDLARYPGPRTLVLETNGFETAPDSAGAYWGAPALTHPRGKAPLVIIYLVDTLRADHTNPYGYARDTTPELAAFAKDAVVFETAITAAAWTKPAVGSLFTSVPPGKHGAVQLRDPLNPLQPTIAEMLKAHGYATGAAIANSVIYSAHTNFEKGFDVFAGLHGPGDRPSKLVEAAPVVDAALSWLDEREGLPTLLYVHTMDPHVPYAAPPPFNRMWEPFPVPGHPGRDPRSDYKEPLDRERLIAQYDGDIAYGDREFGRFVRTLKSRGLYDGALIVFLADHGEEFQDHDQWLHGRSVFDELVHVPLIVKFPRQQHAGVRVSRQVQTMDVLPTVLDVLRLPEPAPAAITGRSLLPAVAGKAPARLALSEITHRGYVAYGMRSEEDKYVWRFSPQEDELYFDLLKDPREKTNRLGTAPAREGVLHSAIEKALEPSPYQHHVRFAGRGAFVVTLHSRGFLEGVETAGFGPGERYELAPGRGDLRILANPQPGQPRDVTFTVRPLGAPVWLSGTRDGHAIAPVDVAMGREGTHPPASPFRLLEVEPPDGVELGGGARWLTHEQEAKLHILEPPSDTSAAVQLWLSLRAGVTIIEMDNETRERLKAMGYIGP